MQLHVASSRCCADVAWFKQILLYESGAFSARIHWLVIIDESIDFLGAIGEVIAIPACLIHKEVCEILGSDNSLWGVGNISIRNEFVKNFLRMILHAVKWISEVNLIIRVLQRILRILHKLVQIHVSCWKKFRKIFSKYISKVRL